MNTEETMAILALVIILVVGFFLIILAWGIRSNANYVIKQIKKNETTQCQPASIKTQTDTSNGFTFTTTTCK